MCVYCHTINKVTTPNKFPISVIDELLDELRDSVFLQVGPQIQIPSSEGQGEWFP